MDFLFGIAAGVALTLGSLVVTPFLYWRWRVRCERMLAYRREIWAVHPTAKMRAIALRRPDTYAYLRAYSMRNRARQQKLRRMLIR